MCLGNFIEDESEEECFCGNSLDRGDGEPKYNWKYCSHECAEEAKADQVFDECGDL